MKKGFILSLFLFCSLLKMAAQDSLSNKFSNLLTAEKGNGDYVYRAVESGIYVIKSTFVIKSNKTQQEFGKAKFKNRYFGYQYNVAMIGKNKLWIPPSVSMPWRLDSAYKEYGDTVRPVLKETSIHVLNDTFIKKLDMSKVVENGGLTHTQSPDSTKNLTMPKDLPTMGCWLLAFYVDEDDKFRNMVTSVAPVWDKNNVATVAKPFLTPKGKLIGGVLLKEHTTFGKIECQFVGSYFFDGTRWIVQAPMMDNQLREVIAPIIDDAPVENKGKPKNGKPKKEEKPTKKEDPKKDMPKKVELPKPVDNKTDAPKPSNL